MEISFNPINPIGCTRCLRTSASGSGGTGRATCTRPRAQRERRLHGRELPAQLPVCGLRLAVQSRAL